MRTLNMNNPLFRPLGFGQPGFGSTPIGTIVPYSGYLDTSNEHMSTALEARGWMLCDGRTLSAARYPELFAVLGYSFGGKDDLFQLPDHRFTASPETDDGIRPAIDETKANVRKNMHMIIMCTHRKIPFTS
ncbi:tail fiber protein [Undibacterium sp. NL8W]|uniref:Tail fiber protein n=2 Tax=Undibacterium umbellatum TaxID=2762300 RepID=A0ABR6Z9L4_9BURK|nr:tail fiber protein [Undibacterium umbellatum]